MKPDYDKLITVLRNDYDIDVSWDGLRGFWNICLTDEGVRRRDMRDEMIATMAYMERTSTLVDLLKAERDELHELVANLYKCARDVGCEHCFYAKDGCEYVAEMREYGIEA